MISGAVGPRSTKSVYVVSILSGAVRTLNVNGTQAELAPDDSLIVMTHVPASSGGIYLSDASGENPRPFIGAEPGEVLWSPTFSPDGKRIVYRKGQMNGNLVHIESRGLDEESSVVLTTDEMPPILSPWDFFERFLVEDFLMLEGRLVFARDEPAPRSDRNLWELAVDPRSGVPQGEPTRLTDWVGLQINGLSATVDGSRLAFRDDRKQTDVWVGELGDDGRRLDNLRRLTLDDRDDTPRCWRPNGQGIVFSSKRYGNTDLFVQDLDAEIARDLVVAPGEQVLAMLSPGGRFYLYIDIDESRQRAELVRIPVGGGQKERLQALRGLGNLQCGTAPGRPCVLAEANLEKKLVAWSLWDPETGKGEELWRDEWLPSDPRVFWTRISPDGSRLATPTGTRIRITEIGSRRVTEIDIKGISGFVAGLAWAVDGNGFYVTALSEQSAGLYHVDSRGNAIQLHTVSEIAGIGDPLPSPDGRYLAFQQATRESNIWLVENF